MQKHFLLSRSFCKYLSSNNSQFFTQILSYGKKGYFILFVPSKYSKLHSLRHIVIPYGLSSLLTW